MKKFKVMKGDKILLLADKETADRAYDTLVKSFYTVAGAGKAITEAHPYYIK